MKKLYILLVASFTLTLGVIAISSHGQRQELAELERAEDKGTLKWYARLAKVKGDAKIRVPAPAEVEYVDDIKNLEAALRAYDVIVAQPVEKKTLVETSTILGREHERVLTWHKFRVLENVSGRNLRQCPGCPVPDFIPREVLPVSADEILVVERGGDVVVEGVEVATPPEFGFSPSKKYLLFLEVDPSGTLGRVMVGPRGVFVVNPDESVSPVSREEHPLKSILKEYGNSVDRLRKEIRGKAARH